MAGTLEQRFEMSPKFKVVYIGGPDGYQATRDTLSDVADVIHAQSEKEEVGEALQNAHGLLDASMKVRISNEIVDRASKLKVISCATTGSDHIERESINERSIPVFTLKEDRELLNNITPAAELSWTLLLACARKLVPAVEHVRQGKWVRESFPGIMLNGKQLGIIGCGRIGTWMARYANAFGMEVVGYDPYLETFPAYIKEAPINEIFSSSHFVSVHVHLSEDTTSLVSSDLLSQARPGLILINTSRGPIVDQEALLEGLKSGRIGAAGLDVLTGEPEIEDHPLINYAKKHDNLLITPHCGGYSPDAVKIVCTHAAKKIKDTILAGR
jgi:phosphoglycerate dehydrogenase-like enzyme